MAKRLCKMNRKQIAANLGEIHRLVVAPKFVCRSCARSSASKNTLCKPAAIPPQVCQDKPLNDQQACGLLAEALPTNKPFSITPKQSAEKTAIVKRVVERVKEKKLADKGAAAVVLKTPAMNDLTDKKALKKAKKALKKQYKQQKKLLKLMKKQQKMLKRQRKLEKRNAQLEALLPTPLNAFSSDSQQAKVH